MLVLRTRVVLSRGLSKSSIHQGLRMMSDSNTVKNQSSNESTPTNHDIVLGAFPTT